MRRALTVGLCVFLGLFAGMSFAAEVTVFGPEQYVRTKGAPNVYTDTFTGLFTEIVNTGKLTVLNGNQTGGNRISSAEIYINGDLIFGPSDFNQNDYLLEAPVDLGESNALYIELRSKPGSCLTIQVTQDIDPPSVTVYAAPDAIKVNENSTLSWSSTLADICSVAPDVGSVDVNGSTVVSPDITTIYTITASGPGGVSTASTTITHVNTAPTAQDQVIVTDEDMGVPILLVAADLDNDCLVYQIVTPPVHGTLTGQTPNLTYDPDEDYCSSDSFTFKANDGLEDSNIATVFLTINPVNDPPVALNDTASTNEDTLTTTGNVLANDSDVDGDILSIVGFTQASNGTVVDNGDGTFTYSPDQDFNGTDSFTYTGSDGNGGADTGTVTMIVDPINDPPTADAGLDQTVFRTDTVTLDGNGSSDVDGDSSRYQWSFLAVPTGSTVMLSDPSLADPFFVPDVSGTYEIELIVNDGTVDSNPDTVVITADPRIVQVPDLVGMTQVDAENAILAADLSVGSVTERYSDTVPASDVISQSPRAGTSMEESSPVDLIVSLGSALPTVSISADPLEIISGESSILTWTSINADSCVIEPGIGTVAVDGSTSVSPAETTTYTITAIGPSGSSQDSTTLVVTPPPDIDIELTSIDVDGVTIDPQTLGIAGTVEVVVRNNGTTDVTESHELTIFEDVDNDKLFSSGLDHVLGTSTISEGPLAESSMTVSAQISGTTQFAHNLIFAFVDSADQVGENNEDNNVIHHMADCENIPPVHSFDPVLEWEWTGGSDIEPDSNQVMSLPVVAQLNDDNKDGEIDLHDIPDIVFSTFVQSTNKYGLNVLRAISGDGSGELFSIPNQHLLLTSNPAVADIDNDGLVEILALSWWNPNHWPFMSIKAFEHDGTFKWESDFIYGEMSRFSSVNVFDLDEDGSPEVISGRVVLNGDGTTKWIGDIEYYQIDDSLVVNLDLQGLPELYSGGVAYRANGDVYWESPDLMYGGWSFAAVANFDEDPYPELAVISWYRLYLAEHTGEVIWQSDQLTGGGGPPLIADLDGDGDPEIGIADATQYMVFEGDGSIKWTSPTQDASSARTGSSAFDFDGDGSVEIVYRDEQYLRIYRGIDGEILYQSEYIGSGTQSEYPLIVDVDNDNSSEIVVVTDNSWGFGGTTGVQVFGDLNDTWVNTRKIWNQHAYHITNVNDDGTIPVVMANNWDIFNNYRQNQILNPFQCKDISASYITIDMSDYPNSITINTRIGNGGALHAAPGMDISMYNGNPDEGGTYLGTVKTQNRLYPGEYEEVSLQWIRPDSGLTAIYVLADTDEKGFGKIRESDEDNNKASATFYIDNRAPLADAGPDQTVVVGTDVTLDGSGSNDPNGDILIYQWSFSSLPSGSAAVLVDSGSVNPSFIPDVLGAYVVQLMVSDGMMESDIDTVTVTAQVGKSVPDIIGLMEVDAEPALSSANLVKGTVSGIYSMTIPENQVINQDPAPGTMVPEFSGVNYTISLGIPVVAVPNVVGMMQEDAELILFANSLDVGTVSKELNTSLPAGQVTHQTPSAGLSVAVGSSVDITIAVHELQVIVPNVTSMTQADAITALNDAGLALGSIFEEYIDVQPAGHVIRSYPAAGTEVSAGTTVDIDVSLGVWTGSDNEPPKVYITATPQRTNIGEDTTITVEATDNAGVISKDLSINGVPVTLSGDEYIYTSSTSGYYMAEASATDAQGNIGTAATVFKVMDPNDIQPPSITVTFLEDGAKITAPTEILGACSDRDIDHWVLEYSLSQAGDWVIIATGQGPSLDAPLGIFDPTLLTNSVYDIRLTAVDLNYNEASHTISCIVSGGLKAGITDLSLVDLQIPVAGIDITVNRRYNSSKKHENNFGVGWSLGLYDIDLRLNRALSGGWYEYYNTAPLINEWDIKPDYPHIIVVTFPDGKTDVFDMAIHYVEPVYRSGGEAYVTFEPRKGTESTLEFVGDQLLFFDGSFLFHSDWVTLFNPVQYILTTKDGNRFGLHRSEGLSWVEETNGNRISIEQAGIFHTSGKSVAFTRDSHGRITQIQDPNNHILTYEYDAAGDLVTFVDQANNTATYAYDNEHNLIEYTDPRGIPSLGCEYDEEGRLIATIDSEGNRIEMSHDLGTYTSVIKDRLGNQTVYVYDDEGNVLIQTDALGHTTSYTYDANANKTSETDALGHTTDYTYDTQNNLLSETDPLGNTTSYTYNTLARVLTITDPLGYVTTNTYDAKGNLLTTTDPLGHVTTNTYDGQGNLLTTTDPLGNVTSYTYDAYGNMLSETNPLCSTTTYTYDVNANQLTQTVTRTTNSGPETLVTTNIYDELNRVIKTVDPDGNFTVKEYNLIGRTSALTDKNGDRTEYQYDSQGNQTEIIYPDGTTEIITYDAKGNRLTSVDKAGRTTQYEYDTLNRLTQTTYPDGTFTKMEYDDAGRLIASIDENGNWTEFGYDAAGRRTSVTDALKNITAFTYDGNGNQLTMIDANGHTMEYVYDELNRKIEMIYPDATFSTVEYDAMGRKVSETDQAGNSTLFDYDAMGRLIGVTDALSQVTNYDYDEVGNKISQIDPNGNMTTWAYDNLGRVITHTLPLGMSESFTYDPNGNMLTRTDFNGDTTDYEYDICCGRLLRTIYPDLTEVIYTYTPTGRRETVTDARGVTIYDYDLRDRVLSVENPDGSTLRYTYDDASNRTSVTTSQGTTTYTFDALNRLETVTDSGGNLTGYTYDPVGNRESVIYPNGTMTSYEYDPLNRLTYLENRKSTSDLISSYTYMLGPAGNRLQVLEHTGRTVDYTYDVTCRLTKEAITDVVNGNETISYTYDLFGNRLTKTDSSGTITYTYDANDRLTAETAPSYTYTYTYDDNGNTLTRSDGSHIMTYDYDFENRLVTVNTGVSATDYEYDADSIRVSSTTDGVVTDYLIDKNRDYAQILEERDGSGSLTVDYVYGDDLISQHRGIGDFFYLYDGQMSTRQLADSSEVVVNEYTYDAFGILLDQAGVVENNYMYTGEQYDPNIGFYYLRARYYEQDIGRFVTTDPWQGNRSRPITLNKYLYANVTPVRFCDPSGKFSLMNQLTVVTVSSIISSTAISLWSFHTIAESGFSINGILLSARFDVSYAGGAFGGGIDILLQNQSGKLYASVAGEVGLHPLSVFKKHRGGGFTAVAGLVFGLSEPNQLSGIGVTAFWPTRALRLMPYIGGKSGVWGAMTQFAKNVTRHKGSVIGFGRSASGPGMMYFGTSYRMFSSMGSYSSDFVPIAQISSEFQSYVDQLSSVARSLSKLGKNLATFSKNADQALGLLP